MTRRILITCAIVAAFLVLGAVSVGISLGLLALLGPVGACVAMLVALVVLGAVISGHIG